MNMSGGGGWLRLYGGAQVSGWGACEMADVCSTGGCMSREVGDWCWSMNIP